MVEKNRKSVRIEGLQAKALEEQKAGEEVKKLANSMLEPWSEMLGTAMFGEKEGGWDVPGLMESIEVAQNEEEKEVREALTIETLLVIDCQTAALTTGESPHLPIAKDAATLTVTLLQRVLASTDEEIAYEYAFDSETLSEARTLDNIRQLIMKPAFPLIGEDLRSFEPYEPYRDFQTERIEEVYKRMDDPKDSEDYHRVHDEWVLEKMQNYTVEEWEMLLKTQCEILLRHVQGSAQRSSDRFSEAADFFANVTRGGENLPQKEIDMAKEVADAQKNLVLGVKQIADFSDLLPWIKKEFGDDADYMTFLQKLSFVDLNQQNPGA